MIAPRPIADPRAAFFAVRLVKGGPEVSARIWRPCHCTVNGTGDPFDSAHEWRETCDRFPPLIAEINDRTYESITTVLRLWAAGREISAAEFHYLRDDAAWCRTFAPNEPRANPRQPVDSRRMAPVRP